ncbi:MAG: MacB family efflux pump subunit [Omnitrophica WOR_2 bacterium GWF2_38_59]|nr:MAG: MacB family efflux pump subunit [Omnitrophica WOR_2 bacterium GWF2_38_59]OGX55031.1 MAG: MacB family efflux pump subunit [Omnitrophica WOR_2 bacterium RIFOXYC2_FULL_38_12]HBG62290.1 MacB family efflux pump subunit [Candidatus Omnitrophota bacterium]
MIEINNISKTYHTDKVPVYALQDVSLSIKAGEFVAIMGPSGSGKSTLLHVLGFLDRPDKGSYKIFNTEISLLDDAELATLRNRLAGFVFQQFHLLRRVSAIENTELPLIYAGKKSIRDKAYEKLESVGLAQRQYHKPNELSGGEQQRVAIARALVNEPMIIFADEPTGNLDTKSEEEIMSILRKLNDDGKTIIMVTHEMEVAAQAKRRITMRDGKIQTDVYKDKTDLKQAVKNDSSIIEDIVSKKHSSFGKMEFLQHCTQSFQAILSNKVRSFLSILGILFGVGAVIAMMALGEGAKLSMEQRLKSLGSNLLSIQGGHSSIRGASGGAGTVTRFTIEDISVIAGMSDYIKKASGSCRGSAQVVSESENWNTSIEGVSYDYGSMRATIPEIGRWFTQEEIDRRDKVAIIGITVANKIFGNRNPIGKEIKINRINFKVIGIAPEKGSGGWRDQDDIVYIPLTTAMYRILGKDYIDQIYAEVKDIKFMAEAQEQIKNVIRKKNRSFNKEDSFEIRDMSEIQEMLSSTTQTMSLLLGCIAAISLLVGGIGIMNIMLVSVTERTREIGLRKAIGARREDIMSQFLIEAVVMTFSGGLIGILLGAGVAFIMAAVFGWATKVSLFSIILSTTFSIAVGIGFGLWPAKKAAQLNPIEALRFE